MTAEKLVRQYVEAHKGLLVTPYMVAAWGAQRGHRYAVATLGAALRQLCPKQGGGSFVAMIREKSRGEQLALV